MLTAVLGRTATAQILVAGAGGGAKEILTTSALEPGWSFTAVDPSPPMMDLAVARLTEHDLIDRTRVVLGAIDDHPGDEQYDAATLIGVLHHLPSDETKRAILRSIARRLKPGAPLILACNHYAYASQPLLLAAWGERWRQQGAPTPLGRGGRDLAVRERIRAPDPFFHQPVLGRLDRLPRSREQDGE